MIVRTYGRRTRCDGRSFTDTSLLDSDSGGADDSDLRDLHLSQDSCHDRRHCLAAAFSSQESSPWSLDPGLFSLPIPETEDPFAFPLLSDGEEEARRTEKKGQNLKRKSKGELNSLKFATAGSETSTLLEAQEFGEMMEHVDEVNFALDGLRSLQPVRIRRASLLSLLNICSLAPRRRMLRARGMADIIIDAILCVNFDDSVSTVAAAALFFILASDVEDNNLLDSPACIGFLLKLLDPPINHSVMKKAPKNGFNLLEIHKPQTLNSAIKGVDSSSRAIICKVKEILLSCDEIRSGSEEEDGMKRPELSSKWIALLTMEKACFSTFSLEDTTEMARNIGGNFRESFRELKGLDAIFGVVSDCHSTLEGWFKKKSLSLSASKDSDSAALESVVFLLKCLKIMENATFMSKDNQNYLLSMKEIFSSGGVPLSFVGIIINCIKFLSGLSLLQRTSSISSKGKLPCLSKGISAPSASQVCMKGKNTDVQDFSSTPYHGTKNSQIENIEVCRKHQKLFTTNLEVSTSNADVLPAKDRSDCSASTSYDMTFHCSNGISNTSTVGLKVNLHPNGNNANPQRNSSGWISIRSIGSKVSSLGQSRRTEMFDILKSDSASDLYDPFLFDEDNLGPSKWENLSSKKRKTQSCKQPVPVKEYVNGTEIPIVNIDDEFSHPTSEVILESSDNSCPSVDEERPSLLEDCLLSSVKVLMNLTNDNIVGCQQIGDCGGLDTLASLIASHFPSFDLYVPIDIDIKETMTSFNRSNESGYLNDRRLQDHELDFLVSILGLLVNLVEKNSINRLRLASACVLVNQPVTSSKEIYKDVVPLLCGIFMSSQGAGNAIVEEKVFAYDEVSLSQSQREAEMMIIEAYTALLLAFLSTESTMVKDDIARCLPSHRLQVLVPVLERFVAFHLTLNMISPETHAAVVKVIESCKEP